MPPGRTAWLLRQRVQRRGSTTEGSSPILNLFASDVYFMKDIREVPDAKGAVVLYRVPPLS